MERSPLATIPPELRNRIYELALSSASAVFITGITQGAGYTVGPHSHQAVKDQCLALSRACKAIRVECIQLFYSTNKFIIEGPRFDTPLQTLALFRQSIGITNASALRDVAISVAPSRVILFHDIGHRGSFRETVKGLQLLAMDDRTCAYKLKVSVQYRGQRFFSGWGLFDSLEPEFDMSNFSKSCESLVDSINRLVESAVWPGNAWTKNELHTFRVELASWPDMVASE